MFKAILLKKVPDIMVCITPVPFCIMYYTLMPMSEPDVMTIVYRMTKRFPWINYCVSVCTLADVPEAFDILHVFVREAERLDEAMTSTTQGIDTLSM